MVRILLRYIASPVPVHDLPRRLIRQVLNLASQLLSRRVLIDEPFSPGIEKQEIRYAEHASHMMGAGRVGTVLKLRSGPECHLMAVTRVGGLSVQVIAGPLFRCFQHSRKKPFQHLFVIHIITCSQNHSPGGVSLYETTLSGFGNYTFHPAL